MIDEDAVRSYAIQRLSLSHCDNATCTSVSLERDLASGNNRTVSIVVDNGGLPTILHEWPGLLFVSHCDSLTCSRD